MKWKSIAFVFWTMVFHLFISTECKGSGGGRGGGRSSGVGKFGGKRGALVAAAGVAGGYAAYKVASSGSRFHSNPLENPAFLSGGGATLEDLNYKTQESTYYNRREGLGMSAFGILAFILGIIGAGTLAWCCYMIGIPFWKDKFRRNRNSNNEGHPLQETPSTATPSP